MMRNFWRLAPWVVAVAILSAFFISDQPLITFVRNYATGEIGEGNFLQNLTAAVTVLRFDKYWWCVIITALLFAFAESVLIVKVSRHMRVGEMLPFPFKGAISVLPMALLFTLGVTVFYELLNMAVVGIAYLLNKVSAIATAVVSAVLLFAIRVTTVYIAAALLLSFPIMFEENYRFTSALSYSVRLASDKRKFLLTVSFVFPMVQLALIALCAWVNLRPLTITLYAVFIFIFGLYAPCVAFKIYYDSVGGVRRDITHSIF